MLHSSLVLKATTTVSTLLETIKTAITEAGGGSLKTLSTIAIAKTVIAEVNEFNYTGIYQNFTYSVNVNKDKRFFEGQWTEDVLQFSIHADIKFENNSFLNIKPADLEQFFEQVKKDFMAEVEKRIGVFVTA